jgi:HPt (histidine-containing phosphotransfer) domain-containing protein
MITHVLRFGNEALDESVEVMGVCIGNVDESSKNINLFNVVPIQHGIHVSTGFSKEDIELFAGLEKEYQEKNMKIVGWYLSRPGWGLDFTEITIQNHKFFQTDKNPHGFVIIFDHTLMGKEKQFGFTINSLKEYKKSNDYFELSYELEKPATLNFFKWVQKFVEDSQRLSPVMIKEIKEESLKDLQDIPLSTEDLIEETLKDYSGQSNQITSGFNNGFIKLNEALANTYETQFNVWIGEITQGILKGMNHISRSINQLKNTLSDGLKDVTKYFNSTFEEISNLFKRNVTDYINTRVEGQKELKTQISHILNSAIEESKITIDSQINNKTTPFEEKIQEVLDALESSSKLNSQISTSIMELNNLTSDKDDNIKNLMKSISENLEKATVPFNAQIDGKFEELDIELKPIKDSYSEIRILLEKLQKTITEFRNLT